MAKKRFPDLSVGPLLTTRDIARYCDTSVLQVNRWIQRGDLKAFRSPGGRYRVTKEVFREFLEQNDIPIIEEYFQHTRPKKILIADDDAGLVEAISEVFLTRYRDVEIETAYDGYETLIKTGDFKPDLLILDIRMPKIDGLEVCRRLREDTIRTPGIKIIVITAHSSSYDRDTVLLNGANGYLKKPFKMKMLIEIVDKLLT